MDISKALKKFAMCWLVVLVLSWASVFFPVTVYEYYATFISILIFCIYMYSLKLFSENFYDVASKVWMVPIVYALMLVIMSMAYSLPVVLLDGVKPNFGNFESFYYCLITLTTVGYGELYPSGYVGQILSSSMALVGTTHMIVFISILVSNLKNDFKVG